MPNPRRAHPSTRVRASGGTVLTITIEDRAALIEGRKRAGLTQRDLADVAGCSQTFIWQLESGRRSRVSAVLAAAIADAVAARVASSTPRPDPGRRGAD